MQVMRLKAFLAQPIPPPPPYWLYARRVAGVNQTAITRHDPEMVSPGSSMEELLRLRQRGWPAATGASWAGNDMWHLPKQMYYSDDREFEAIQHSIIMRESQYQKCVLGPAQRVHSCSGRYAFNLEPFRSNQISAPQYFNLFIRVRGDYQDKILPVPGTPVTISTTAPEHHELKGQVIDLGIGRGFRRVDMVVTWRPGVAKLLAEGDRKLWQGDFNFELWGGQVKKTRAAISMLLHGGPYLPCDSWLKELFMARRILRPNSNNTFFHHATYNRAVQLLGLNQGQAHALRLAVTTDEGEPFSVSRQTICQGPPGTGKTQVITSLAMYCIWRRLQGVCVAGSNLAVAVLGARLLRALIKANETDRRVFLLKSEEAEQLWQAEHLQEVGIVERPQDLAAGAGQSVSSSSSSSPSPESRRHGATQPGPSSVHPSQRQSLVYQAAQYLPSSLSSSGFQRLEALLISRVSGDDSPFSLTRYIMQRIKEVKRLLGDFMASGRENLRQEIDLIFRFVKADRKRRTLPLEGQMAQDEDGEESFDARWLDLQKFHLRQAAWVLVTADSSCQRALHWMQASVVVADEAAQLTEPQMITATARNLTYNKLKKLILFGDHQQLGPTALSYPVNEFGETALRGYMGWQNERGQPYTQLTVQYRMHHEISAFVSEIFYNGTLVDDPSVFRRGFDPAWEAFSDREFGTTRHSIFLDVEGRHDLYHQRDETSLVNPDTLCAILGVMRAMHHSPEIDIFDEVLIIAFYTAQTTLLQNVMAAEFFDPSGRTVDIRTVDSVQGHEKKLVLLDFVRPGPSVGFLADMNRLCVAFSRAQHALIGVGSAGMAAEKLIRGNHVRPNNLGEEVLRRYVVVHETRGSSIQGCCNVEEILTKYVNQRLGFRRIQGYA